ncbi:MAG TPA: ATP-binding protein [Bdellovibrionales bacterium]|nr:ATP-binding protein [Bdellovibrionales bacterium]
MRIESSLSLHEPGTADQALNGLARLAASLFSVPYVGIVVLDKDKLYLDGKHGFDFGNLPANTTLCPEMLQDPEILVYPDIAGDEHFEGNPNVIGGLKFRFYCSAPIIYPNGRIVGGICLMDREPREFDDGKKVLLRALADQARALIEMRQLNAQLIEQHRKLSTVDKMFAVGELAASVAHEINSPLLVIAAQAQMLVDEADELPKEFKSSVKKSAEMVLKMSERIGLITRSLRQQLFDGDQQQEKIEFRTPVELVENALEICGERIRSHRIEMTLDLDGTAINCRPTLVSQILVNLLSNSIEAIENIEPKWIKVSAKKATDQMVFTVVDSGPTPTGEFRARWMEPFYTTKPKDKGLGLGLNLSKRLAESSGGSLNVDFDAVNTTFILALPLK